MIFDVLSSEDYTSLYVLINCFKKGFFFCSFRVSIIFQRERMIKLGTTISNLTNFLHLCTYIIIEKLLYKLSNFSPKMLFLFYSCIVLVPHKFFSRKVIAHLLFLFFILFCSYIYFEWNYTLILGNVKKGGHILWWMFFPEFMGLSMGIYMGDGCYSVCEQGLCLHSPSDVDKGFLNLDWPSQPCSSKATRQFSWICWLAWEPDKNFSRHWNHDLNIWLSG